jgi:putative transposase
MDGRGRWIERQWRSPKNDDIYFKGYTDGREARVGTNN